MKPRRFAGDGACANLVPRKIVTDQLRSYPAAKADIPELVGVKHLFVKAAARLNNRAENSHQPTRERERRMRGFRDPKRTQQFLSCFGRIRQHFALRLPNGYAHRATTFRNVPICCFKTFRIANGSWKPATSLFDRPSNNEAGDQRRECLSGFSTHPMPQPAQTIPWRPLR